MRLHYGPGYRIYFAQTGRDEYTLLAGGTKERQQSDIDLAKDIKRELEKWGSW
jgi:putative addiction module killer protein